jgi:MOSC domain-containing protein YiiM
MEREHGIAITGAQSRRNLLTRGISLNPLVGREFRVGDVKLRGIELCEPCRHLERLTMPGVLKGLVHRGGLRAQILEGGTIRPGDLIEEIPSR